jgi:hypothetical protein
MLTYADVSELPPELAQLVNVSILSYEHNPVVNPPDEIRKQGAPLALADVCLRMWTNADVLRMPICVSIRQQT